MVLAFAVLLLFAGLLLRDIVRVRNDVKVGQARLSHLQLTQLDSRASVEASLGSADRRLREAASVTRDSPWLKLLTPIPKVGRQIRAARDLTAAAAQVADIGYRAATAARTQLDAPRRGPADRLRLIDNLNHDMVVAAAGLDKVRPGATGPLSGTLAQGRVELLRRLAQAKVQLADGLRLTATLRTMLAGPRTYLVLAGNNAEMRSGGIATAAGLIHFESGDLTTSRFISSFDLFLNNQNRVPVPPDLAHLYGWMAVGQEWRTTNTSPNWPQVAGLYATMSAKSALGPVDGVLFLDVLSLRAVLRVVGPVDVEGTRYSAANVEEQLLFRNYLRFPTHDQTDARREVQSQVANAAFFALRSAGFSIPRLAQELSAVTKGRHLLAWSTDPAEEAMWTKLGADGTLTPNDFMVSVQNVSGSKLDYFIDPKVTVNYKSVRDHQEVDVGVAIQNPRRGESSAYVEGGERGYVVPGDQRVYVLLYLPATAYDAYNRDPAFNTIGSDAGMKVVGLIFVVAYGQTSEVHVSFRLPLSQNYAVLVPSSRLRPQAYTINGAVGVTDAKRTLIPL